MYKHAASALCFLMFLVVVAAHDENEGQLIDLSVPDYEIADSYNSATYSNLLNVAMHQNSDVNAMVALEHGQMVVEYHDDDFSFQKFDLWSGTKAWTALLFGVMEQEGLIRMHDTLGDIFSNASVWDTVEDAEVRKNITIKHFLQMRAGLSMPRYVCSLQYCTIQSRIKHEFVSFRYFLIHLIIPFISLSFIVDGSRMICSVFVEADLVEKIFKTVSLTMCWIQA